MSAGLCVLYVWLAFFCSIIAVVYLYWHDVIVCFSIQIYITIFGLKTNLILEQIGQWFRPVNISSYLCSIPFCIFINLVRNQILTEVQLKQAKKYNIFVGGFHWSVS